MNFWWPIPAERRVEGVGLCVRKKNERRKRDEEQPASNVRILRKNLRNRWGVSNWKTLNTEEIFLILTKKYCFKKKVYRNQKGLSHSLIFKPCKTGCWSVDQNRGCSGCIVWNMPKWSTMCIFTSVIQCVPSFFLCVHSQVSNSKKNIQGCLKAS